MPAILPTSGLSGFVIRHSDLLSPRHGTEVTRAADLPALEIYLQSIRGRTRRVRPAKRRTGNQGRDHLQRFNAESQRDVTGSIAAGHRQPPHGSLRDYLANNLSERGTETRCKILLPRAAPRVQPALVGTHDHPA